MRARLWATAAALTAAVTLLGACSNSTGTDPTTPPSTTTPSPTVTPSPTPSPTPTIVRGRNPYEMGADRDWSIPIDAAPTKVTFDRQSGTVVVATKVDGKNALVAYEVTNSGRTIPRWNYESPDGANFRALDAGNGRIYATVGDDSATDLIIIKASSGNEEFRWTRDNRLDEDVPEIVGFTDEGLGVIKADSNSIVAAVLNDSGHVVNDARTRFREGEKGVISVSRGIVDTGLKENDSRVYITFPELRTIVGDFCYSTTDGAVCIDGISASRPVSATQPADVDPSGDPSEAASQGAAEPTSPTGSEGDPGNEPSVAPTTTAADPSGEPTTSETPVDGTPTDGTSEPGDTTPTEPGDNVPESATAEVIEYDRAGHKLRITDVEADSAAMSYVLLEMNEDVSTRELGRALAETVVSETEGPDAAILTDGEWLPMAKWDLGRLGVNIGEPVPGGAPFYLLGDGVNSGAITNVATGEVLNQTGSLGLAGQGSAANMFFEWDGESLYFLKPRG